MRRLTMFTVLVSLIATGAPGGAAATAGCVPHTTAARYRPTITWACAAAVATASAVVTRVSTHAAVGADPIAGAGTTALALALHGDLASGAAYKAVLTYDDGSGPTTLATSWRTLPPPAHPGLHVKYITAIPAAAVLDTAHRVDLANIVAVPRPADFIDAGTAPARSLDAYTSALRGHQSALVLSDERVYGGAALATALARFCNAGHGVVVGGQAHWIAGAREGWQVASAVGSERSVLASKWSMFAYDDVAPDQVSTGSHELRKGSIVPSFLTRNLTHFTVIGPGSGEGVIQDYFSGRVLATLKASPAFSSPFHQFGQVLLSDRQIGAGRLVDLGFRPWSSAVDQGGFDPSQSPGGALTARALWWATNRIPPTDTHFTTTPARESDRATVLFTMAAKDQDRQTADDLHFRYRLDHGSWHRAVGDSFALYHLAQGSTHTVSARAFDSGGNVDAHVAAYTFHVLPGALG